MAEILVVDDEASARTTLALLLDKRGHRVAQAEGVGAARMQLSEQRSLADREKAHILEALERCGWNHSRAAEALGIGRTTLWRKLKDYGLDSPA